MKRLERFPSWPGDASSPDVPARSWSGKRGGGGKAGAVRAAGWGGAGGVTWGGPRLHPSVQSWTHAKPALLPPLRWVPRCSPPSAVGCEGLAGRSI